MNYVLKLLSYDNLEERKVFLLRMVKRYRHQLGGSMSSMMRQMKGKTEARRGEEEETHPQWRMERRSGDKDTVCTSTLICSLYVLCIIMR